MQSVSRLVHTQTITHAAVAADWYYGLLAGRFRYYRKTQRVACEYKFKFAYCLLLVVLLLLWLLQ